jgi:hypothetical protein
MHLHDCRLFSQWVRHDGWDNSYAVQKAEEQAAGHVLLRPGQSAAAAAAKCMFHQPQTIKSLMLISLTCPNFTDLRLLLLLHSNPFHSSACRMWTIPSWVWQSRCKSNHTWLTGLASITSVVLLSPLCRSRSPCPVFPDAVPRCLVHLVHWSWPVMICFHSLDSFVADAVLDMSYP